MYTFIHPTKTGGISFGTYLKKWYPTIIQGDSDHKNKCSRTNNPIVIVREPLDRFISQYNFWKYGSNYAICKHVGINTFTIDDYIHFIKSENRKLVTLHTRMEHHKPQSFWTPKDVYSNTIVIRYTKTLNDALGPLLRYLGLEPRGPFCSPNNITRQKDSVVLNTSQIEWIKEYYKEDFDIWGLVNTQPELFKYVI